ncbi:polysaccharide deacetylase family protein [Gorillibacterium timonense]|uniref:polysaccharide deacetylase family protein n=1 Tax=Gorillibacterium timonense TaxID=1689269 RepID=UPI00071DDE6F|nr:polysaccharide deacetylase family protein [Gorillibacterium timonense]
MGIETYSIQVIELLSLGKTSDGGHQIEVAVTHEDKHATYVIDIDEFTFRGLEVLQPLNGGRARLSPYPKWDPYRNTYYCSLIKTTSVSRETLPYACSEEYLNQLKRIRQTDLPPIPMSEGGQDDGVKKPARNQARWLRQFPAQAPRVANLLLVMYVLLLVLSIPSEGKANAVNIINGPISEGKVVVTANDSNDLNDSIVPASMSNWDKEDLPSMVVAADQQQVQTQASIQPSADQVDYEVMDVAEEKIFGLPKNYIALTFDDGPSTHTQKIVDILTENKVAATFLFVGKNVERNPDAVTYASEHGMSIGNHSWDHSVLTKATPANQSKNLSMTSNLIESLTHASVTLFRPPYGAVNDELVNVAKKQHMKTLLWNRDPEDWNAKKPEDIIRYFHEVDVSGGVYVLHEDKNTVDALPAIINYLKEKNVTFVIFK